MSQTSGAELAGRVALVTGGGRGIGRGISELLAANGATIAVNYRKDLDAANEVVDGIHASGGAAKAYAASIDDAEADAAMVEAILADFGHIDIRADHSLVELPATLPPGTEAKLRATRISGQLIELTESHERSSRPDKKPHRKGPRA